MAPHALDTPPASTTPTPLPSKMAQHLPRIEAVTDTSAATIPDPVMQAQPTQSRFGVKDVIPHRKTSKALMAKGVAPFSSATMFKSTTATSKPKATKSFYESHLSREAKARKNSSLKGAMKFLKPETISLCGGLPSAEYFPFEELAFEVPTVSSFSPVSHDAMSNRNGAASAATTVAARKYDVAEGKSDIDLHIALNYGQSMGPPQLMRYLTEHTEIIHAPSYSDWEICLTQGTTSAFDIALRMFCEEGDALLTEEYSFSSAIEAALPQGLVPVGIEMDGKGLRPERLEHVLGNWEELRHTKYRGASRPKLLYTVPTGQNPTGATQDLERRKAILEICEKYDVFIIEDEPYYFLQMEPYVPKVKQANGTNGHASTNGDVESQAAKSDDLGAFIDALVPSYLHLSKTGNVMRMDSFSKILAPGSRTGWVTGPADIIERFVRASEVSAQTPSGFSMVALYKLLEEAWGHEGFLRWLQSLRTHYSTRRDGIVFACEEHLPTEYVQFEAPMAGMFHWLRVDGSKHEVWKERSPQLKSRAEKRALLIELEEKIFATAAEKNVLIARGSWFRAEKDNHSDGSATPDNGQEINTTLYFRMTFAAAPMDKIAEAVRRFGETLRVEFGAQ